MTSGGDIDGGGTDTERVVRDPVDKYFQDPGELLTGLREALNDNPGLREEVGDLLGPLWKISSAGRAEFLRRCSARIFQEETELEQLTVKLRAGLVDQSFSSLQQFSLFLKKFAESNNLCLVNNSEIKKRGYDAGSPSIELKIGDGRYGVSICYGSLLLAVVWSENCWKQVNVLDEVD